MFELPAQSICSHLKQSLIVLSDLSIEINFCLVKLHRFEEHSGRFLLCMEVPKRLQREMNIGQFMDMYKSANTPGHTIMLAPWCMYTLSLLYCLPYCTDTPCESSMQTTMMIGYSATELLSLRNVHSDITSHSTKITAAQFGI